jgi:hypothetical protein
MKKKKKFNLEVIKVKSFITSLNDDEKNKINGGIPGLTDPDDTCMTQVTCDTCISQCGNCATLDCPSYICEEFRTDQC